MSNEIKPKPVPEYGYNVQGQPESKADEPIHDVNKLVGVKVAEFHFQEPQSGLEPIIEKTTDIADSGSSSSASSPSTSGQVNPGAISGSSSLEYGAELRKQSFNEGAELPNEALEPGQTRKEKAQEDA